MRVIFLPSRTTCCTISDGVRLRTKPFFSGFAEHTVNRAADLCADTDRRAVTPFNADGFDTFSVRQLEHILVGITAAIYGFHCERLTGGSNLSAVKRCKSTAGFRFSHHLGIFFVSKTIRVSPHSFQCQFLAHKNLPKQKTSPTSSIDPTSVFTGWCCGTRVIR